MKRCPSSVSIARDIIRQRRELGLTQAQLAKLAGIRQETLSRLESGKHKPNVRTIERIESALKWKSRSDSLSDVPPHPPRPSPGAQGHATRPGRATRSATPFAFGSGTCHPIRPRHPIRHALRQRLRDVPPHPTTPHLGASPEHLEKLEEPVSAQFRRRRRRAKRRTTVSGGPGAAAA